MICFADCSSEIEITVNSGSPVDTGVSLTVGDVLSCSAEGALSYRWTNLHNDNNEETYGKTISVSQPGNFNYECSVFLECNVGLICPFTKHISGFATGIAMNLFDIFSTTKVTKMSNKGL